jgi:hypothetical protein
VEEPLTRERRESLSGAARFTTESDDPR